jgi:hypothetical protein
LRSLRTLARRLAYFDELAAVIESLDDSFDDVRARFQEEHQLRVPGEVFNALLQKTERV